MKKPLLIIASIIIAASQTTFADSNKANDNKLSNLSSKQPSKKKAEGIESLLAEKNLIQGKVAKRIRTYNIDTWRWLDNYHIFIEGKGKDNDYLIQFRNRCYGTRNGSTLIYKTNNNELTKFDTIGVLDSFINSHGMNSHDILRPARSCIIQDIYYLNNLTDNELNTVTVEDTKKRKRKEKEGKE